MKYALGNMLNGAGGLNPDGLSLDLQFATDKTLAARKGPTPVFTRGSTGTFVGSDGLIQSAAINGPRFDHDPVTLACKGLLIEESRTNLFVRSEEFSTSWTITDATLSTNAIISPDGNTTADKLIVNSGASNGRTAQTFALTGSHTMSIFAKAGEWSWIFLAPIGPGSGVWFNLSNGTIGTQSAGFTGAITSFGNGWYRCAVTCTGAGVATSSRIVSTNANSTLSTGDGASGIFIWGAQLEAGSFPTSYIPTTTASLARSADVCSITGSAFTGFWNDSEGTVVVEASLRSPSNNVVVWAAAGGANSAANLYMYHLGAIALFVQNTTGQVSISSGSYVANTTSKVSACYKLNDFAVSRDGGAVVTDTLGTIPFVDKFYIGNFFGGFASSQYIESIRFYKKRLPNAKLQSLTV